MRSQNLKALIAATIKNNLNTVIVGWFIELGLGTAIEVVIGGKIGGVIGAYVGTRIAQLVTDG